MIFSLLGSERRIAAFLAVVILQVFPGVARIAAQTPASVIIRLRAGVELREVIKRVGAHIDARAIFHSRSGSLLAAHRLDRYVIIDTATSEVLAHLAADDDVEQILPNHRYHLDAVDGEAAQPNQWALRRIEAEGAWAHTRGSDSVLIGFLDTGIELAHPNLREHLWINRREDINGNGRFDPWPVTTIKDGTSGDLDGIDQDRNGYTDDVVGYDFVDQTMPNLGDWYGRDPDPSDDNGHGTTVAGILAGAGRGAPAVVGIAPASPLVTLRAFDATGNAEDDDIAAAIVYAADNGVSVLNMSFGDTYRSILLHDAIRYAYDRGVVLVASAGNLGVSVPHYPSSFPEVISVAMTDSADRRDLFSNYGSQITLAAPGRGVLSVTRDTAVNTEVSGTSIAAPYVAGVAALVRAVHRDWTPDEVRAALELTADDLLAVGWDLYTGSGRLNARRAVEFGGPAAIAITSPEPDLATSRDTLIRITGSASSPLLAGWDLSIGAGEMPEEWTSITGPQKEAKVNDVLGEVHTGTLTDTTWTIRLRLRQTNGREAERRQRLFVDRTPPRFTSAAIENVWRFDERALAVIARTDDITRLTVWLRPTGSDQPFRSIALEPERTGYVHNHYVIITRSEMTPGVRYDLFVVAQSVGLDTAMIGSPGIPLSAVLVNDGFPLRGFAHKPWTAPYGFIGREAVELYGPGTKAFAINRSVDGGYGPLVIEDFENGVLAARDSIAEKWLPRSFGDVDGDGLKELLVQGGASSRIYEQRTPGGRVLASILFDDTSPADTTLKNIWGAKLADVDGDGRDELIGRTDFSRKIVVGSDTLTTHYFVAKWIDGTLRVIARLPNPTPPARGSAHNEFGSPTAVVADFDGDGAPEILVGDDDADFLVYKRNTDGTWRILWTQTNDGKGGSEMIASGDFDGDGRSEAVLGYRAETGVENPDGEYDQPFWTMRVMRINDDGSDSLLWQDRFAYVRDPDPFRSGVSAGNLDGRPGDELAISIFPGLYLIRRDPSGAFRPLWWRGGSLTNTPLIADLDGNGRSEVGTGNSRTIDFYESDQTGGTGVPGGLNAYALGDTSAAIEWSPVDGATGYRLYRGAIEPGHENEPITFNPIGETTLTSAVDTGIDLPEGHLLPGRRYAYTVTALDGALEGDFAAPVVVLTHPRVRPIRVVPDARSIVVHFDGPVSTAMYRSGAIDLRIVPQESIVTISSVSTAGDSALAAHLPEGLAGDSLKLRLTWLFRDALGSPGDTLPLVSFRLPAIESPGSRFIATSAVLIRSGRTNEIAISFSAPVDPTTATALANYRLSPPFVARNGGTGDAIAAVRVDPADPARVILTINPDYPIGALGREYLVTITDVRSEDGRLLNEGRESVVGFTIEAPDLNAVMVYPQPFDVARDARATFAGLPRGASVEVLTLTGRRLRLLKESEHEGGVEWDGRDERGEFVPTGIYLYRAFLPVTDGGRSESDLKKIAVIGGG